MKIFGKEISVGSAVASVINGASDRLFKTHRTALAELAASSFRSNAGPDSLPAVSNRENLKKWGDFVSSVARRDSIIFKDKDGKPAIPPSLAKTIDQAVQLLAAKSEEMHMIQEHLAAIKAHPDAIVAKELVVRSAALVMEKKKTYVQFNPTVFNNHYAPLHAMAAESTANYLSAFSSADKAAAMQPIKTAAFADIDLFLQNKTNSLPDAYTGIDRILKAFEGVNLPDLHSKCQSFRATMLERAIADGNMGFAIQVLEGAEGAIRQQHGIPMDTGLGARLNNLAVGPVEALQAQFLAASKKLRVFFRQGEEKSTNADISAKLRKLHLRMQISKTNYNSDPVTADTLGHLFDMAATLGDKDLMRDYATDLGQLVQSNPGNISAAGKFEECLQVCAKKGVEVNVPGSEPPAPAKPAAQEEKPGTGQELAGGIVAAVIAARTGQEADVKPQLAGIPAKANTPDPAVEATKQTIGIIRQTLMAPNDIRRTLNEAAIGTPEYSKALSDLVATAKASAEAFPDLEGIANTESLKMKKNRTAATRADMVNIVQAATIGVLRKSAEPSAIEKLLRACRVRLGLQDTSLRYAFRQAANESAGIDSTAAMAKFEPALTASKAALRIDGKTAQAALVTQNAGNPGN